MATTYHSVSGGKCGVSAAAKRPHLMRTTWFVENLHCPSCVVKIQDVLLGCNPEDTSEARRTRSRDLDEETPLLRDSHEVSHLMQRDVTDLDISVLNRTVCFTHDQSLDMGPMLKEMDRAGFDVVPEKSDHLPLSKRTRRQSDLSPCPEQTALPQYLPAGQVDVSAHPISSKQGPSSSWKDLLFGRTRQKRRAHVRTCRACAAKQEREKWWSPQNVKGLGEHIANQSDANSAMSTAGEDGMREMLATGSITGRDIQEIKKVEIPEHTFRVKRGGWREAQFSVSGMTCSSCVGAISRVLDRHPAIRSSDVTLMNSAARVVFNSDIIDTKQIVDLISDAGFDANLSSQEALQLENEASNSENVIPMGSDTSDAYIPYQVLLSVEGMTCASCSSSITRALTTAQNIKMLQIIPDSLHIDVLGASARCQINAQSASEAESLSRRVAEHIEETGFDARVMQITPTKSDDNAREKARSSKAWTASFSIRGLTNSKVESAAISAIEHEAAVSKVEIDPSTRKVRIEYHAKDAAAARLRCDKYAETLRTLSYTIGDDLEVRALNSNIGQSQTRTVRIRIDGMYCEECIARVNASVAAICSKRTANISCTRFSLSNPTISITYIPKPPEFTVRTFLEALEALDFAPRVVHSDQLEQRARQIHAKETQLLVIRFGAALLFSIPTFIIAIVGSIFLPDSNSFKIWLMRSIFGGVSRATFALFLIATPVQFGVGWLFYERAFRSLRGTLRRGRKDSFSWLSLLSWGSMDLLVVIGTSLAYFSSLALMILAIVQPDSNADSDMTSFDTSVFLQMFILLGRVLESISKGKTTDAIRKLGQMKPETCLLVPARKHTDQHSNSEDTQIIRTDSLEVGDQVLVPAGSMPPTDGVIIEGESSFDESSLTGEAHPVHKSRGDEVSTGTQNLRGAVVIRTTSEPGASTIDRITKVVQSAQGRKASLERLAEKVTGYFVPVIVYLAMLTLLVWVVLGTTGKLPLSYLETSLQTGGWTIFALQFAIAVVVVACPCGIGLAAPTAQMVGTGLAASHGILANGGGEAFAKATRIDSIAFDKTGTITTGNMQVTDIRCVGSVPQSTTFAILSAVEAGSTHPVASAIQRYCSSSDGEERASVTIKTTEEISGQGLQAVVCTTGAALNILIGSERLIRRHTLDSALEAHSKILSEWEAKARTTVLVACKSEEDAAFEIIALVAVADPPRQEAQSVVAHLRSCGLNVYMITGDNDITAQSVASLVGIDPKHVISGVLPEEKAAKIEDLQSIRREVRNGLTKFLEMTGLVKVNARCTARSRIAFVGDGINDAPALAQADASMAIGSGSQIAVQTADFVLLSSNLSTIPKLISISKVVDRRIKINFGWAMIYNCALVPIAAGVFYPLGHTRLPPIWSALAMSLSSVSVVLSSLALRYHKPNTVKMN